MRFKTSFQILFIVIACLAVYYPSLSVGINSVDDAHIVAAYESSADKNPIEFFIPKSSHYVRPLVEISFYLDNLLWAMHPRFMHLENILLHICNALLLYCFARQLCLVWGNLALRFPFYAALLFAVHPINTESVTWIAGRTDPLASVFVLSAYIFLVKSITKEKLFYLIPAFFFAVLACLSKEVALFFFPSALCLIYCWPTNSSHKQTVVKLLSITLFVIFMLAVYVIWNSASNSVYYLLNNPSGEVINIIKNIFISFGFYLTKLIQPFPLNFAIDKVTAWFIVPGILGSVLLFYFMVKWRSQGVLFVICCLFLVPALLISIKQVAWTPYAERYLYLPSAFFALLVSSGFSGRFMSAKRSNLITLFMIISIVAGSYFTVERNLLWQDFESLYRDTIKKSPQFGAVHLELAGIMLRDGRIEEAAKELELAEKYNKRDSIKYLIKEKQMLLKIMQEDYVGAREFFYRTFNRKIDADIVFLRLLNKTDELVAAKSSNIKIKKQLYSDMIDTYDVMYKKSKDPFYLYQSALLEFRAGNKTNSLNLMKKVVDEAPLDSHYLAASKVWLKRLESR